MSKKNLQVLLFSFKSDPSRGFPAWVQEFVEISKHNLKILIVLPDFCFEVLQFQQNVLVIKDHSFQFSVNSHDLNINLDGSITIEDA